MLEHDSSLSRSSTVLRLPIMTVLLELEPEVELSANDQAQEEGLPLAKYVESLVRDAVLRRQRVRRMSEKPFDEILRPFRKEVEACGITDDELDKLFRRGRSEAAKVRRNK